MGRLFLLGCCAFLALAKASDSPASAQPDFRKATWGMTRTQVLATEPAKPADIRESNGVWIVRYDAVQFGGLACRAVYIFANDKLVRGKYVFTPEHAEPNDFIVDFRAVEPLLHDKYGKPVSERALWADDTYQDEPKSYLDQDRASSADILPSDRFVGLSISEGHLRLYAQWQSDRTKVLHGLTGADDHITHQIEFLGVELEKLEREVRTSH
jgi:hypothetical protein